MTPKEKLAAALEALDHARRALEQLSATATGDDEIDEGVAAAADTIEAEIAGLHLLHIECV
jgi:hypothetical protein